MTLDASRILARSGHCRTVINMTAPNGMARTSWQWRYR
jgi:hypothetical protein